MSADDAPPTRDYIFRNTIPMDHDHSLHSVCRNPSDAKNRAAQSIALAYILVFEGKRAGKLLCGLLCFSSHFNSLF